MKKKCGGGVALLLTLCLLFSSCAASGTNEPAFSTLWKKNFSGVGKQITALVKRHTPLQKNGEEQCNISLGNEISPAVRKEIDTLFATIEQKTGLRPTVGGDSTDGVPLYIGLATEFSGRKPNELHAANYFVGFFENQFFVTANNQIMLKEAVAHFCTMLNEETDITLGEGYLAISSALSHYGSVRAVFDGDRKATYQIVHAEDATQMVSDAATAIQTAVRNATSGSLPIRTDFLSENDESNIREIIVGTINREDIQTLSATLAPADYYIGTQNESIVILGSDDYALQAAVNRFISLFITGDTVHADKQERTLFFPAVFTCRNEAVSVFLASDAGTDFALIYPARSSDAFMNAIKTFAHDFHRITGAVLPIFSDEEAPMVTGREILVGEVDRPAAKGRLPLPLPKYTFEFTDEDTLLLRGQTDEALAAGLTALADAISDYAAWQNGGNATVEIWGVAIYVKPQTVYVPLTLSQSGEAEKKGS